MNDQSAATREAVLDLVMQLERELNKLALRWRDLQALKNPTPANKKEIGNIEAIFDQLEAHDWSIKKRAY